MREKLIELVAEYLDITVDEVNFQIENNHNQAVEDWYDMGMDEYYKNTLVHLFGLADFCTQDRIDNFTHPFKSRKGLKILDFGGGIAAISMALADDHDVYYYDLESQTQDFAKFAVNKLNKKVTFLNKDEMEKMKFDVIITADVLEHLIKPMNTVKKLYELINPKGYFMSTGLRCQYKDDNPMHLKENMGYINEYEQFCNEKFKIVYIISTKKECIVLYVKRDGEVLE